MILIQAIAFISFLFITNIEIEADERHKLFSSCHEKFMLSNNVEHSKNSDDMIINKNTCCDCDRKFGIVQKIVLNTDSNPVKIPLSSVCVRCDLCLIIADKINETLIDVHKAMSPHVQWLNHTEADNLLRLICNQFFHRFKLREIKGEPYIGKNLPGSNLIELSDDELWEVELRKKCTGLIQVFGTSNIYKYWLKWFIQSQNINLATIFCRSSGGIFSDCKNFRES